MKKTLNNVFDEANANELEKLVNQNAAFDVSADTLSSIKNKVYAKTGIIQTKTKNSFALRWQSYVAVAACFALIIGAIIAIPMLRDNEIPSISTMMSGDKLTGKQQVVYGNPPSDSEEHVEFPTGFVIHTVIEAEVIEVLPDTYYSASHYLPFHVAKLRVIDPIRGEGLPKEIYLCYPYYDKNVFEGYERFIMSLRQVGVENYMLVNETQGRVDYFPNMFEVVNATDLGAGAVIAFNDGKLDESFWDKATPFYGFDARNLLGREHYPVDSDSTIEQAKENILKRAQEGYVWGTPFDYVTADDIFISAEGKEIQEYVAPAPANVFMQDISITDDRIVAKYTRVINGFLSEEVIVVNSDNGNVLREGDKYTASDLEKIPDIGEVLAGMNLSELKPPHIKITDRMEFSYSNATGVYRKVDGKVYGIIRVMWYYKYLDNKGLYQKDVMFYLYDENGKVSDVESDVLREIIVSGELIVFKDFPMVA